MNCLTSWRFEWESAPELTWTPSSGTCRTRGCWQSRPRGRNCRSAWSKTDAKPGDQEWGRCDETTMHKIRNLKLGMWPPAMCEMQKENTFPTKQPSKSPQVKEPLVFHHYHCILLVISARRNFEYAEFHMILSNKKTANTKHGATPGCIDIYLFL